ncbi:hypothetical protein [Subtercola lobariae]|uniref:N-acetyltransferase domain-containing protein n=1 Tax=Subtercola lobariae TaxID=1588641 RepID=A0A917BAS0_9MICO|nr:hypothetical protein [Subtercola lobariae]GGF28599.1 hypothetical protein GCM10011399_22210 [Subtercola lobariae]
MLTVEQVSSERALREFIELPLRLWPRDLAVPLLESSIRSWYSGRSPHPEPIELVVVRDASGTVVGRSTMHTDRRFDEKLGEKLQLFGATEFETEEAALALFDHFEQRAEATHHTALFGPVSLLPNQSGGVITSGFDERGFVDSAWNPPWVADAYERAGFARWGEADTWIVAPVGVVPPQSRAKMLAAEAAAAQTFASTTAGSADAGKATGAPTSNDATTPGRVLLVGVAAAPTAAEWASAGVRLEYGSKRHMKTLVPELLELLNASFEQLPYYTQITPAEMVAATDGLAFLLDERLLLVARDARSSRATAFILVIPDITEFVQKVGGKLSLARQLQLLATRSRYRREAVLVIQGTDPIRQGQGILSLLSRQLQVNLRAGGYRALRSTYVDRENVASTAQFARFGGRPLQGYTFYRRPLVRGGATQGLDHAAVGPGALSNDAHNHDQTELPT